MKGNFNSLIESTMPVLVDFHAEWCEPCKVQSPILAEIAPALSGKLRIIKIDVDKNPEITGRYQIRGVPTLALFKEGKVLWRQSGLIDKNNLLNLLKSYL